jgi:hypothetical protein
MKGVHVLVLVAVMSLGVLLGLHGQKGLELISQASSVARANGLSEPQKSPLSERTGTTAGVTEGEVLVRLSLQDLRNVQAVGVWGTCDGDDLANPPNEDDCVFTVDNVQYRLDRTPGEDVVYFNVVCTDLGWGSYEKRCVGGDDDGSLCETGKECPAGSCDFVFDGSIFGVETCSTVERESLSFGVGIPLGVGFQIEGGASALAQALAGIDVEVEVDLSLDFPIHRRLRYPKMTRPTGLNRMGGNVLIDSGIGSVVAARSIVFGHSDFNGDVNFFITKPKKMRLTWGYLAGVTPGKGEAGTTCGGAENTCTDEFAFALERACDIGNLGGCPTPGAAVDSTARGTDAESDFDMQEVVEALDAEKDTITDITAEIKRRVKEKVSEVFDTWWNSSMTQATALPEVSPTEPWTG